MFKTFIGFLIIIGFIVSIISTFPIIGYILVAILIAIISLLIYKKHKKLNTVESKKYQEEEKRICENEKPMQNEEYHNQPLNQQNEDNNSVSAFNETTENNKIYAKLTNCYTEERQNILKRVYINKNSEEFHIVLSFEHIVENDTDIIKVLVDDKTVGFIDKDNTSRILPVLDKMDSCLFHVYKRTFDDEKYYDVDICITIKE
ncbi:MAG: hypothetical protein IJB45_01945 [Clostridia bacterium]|nr:hypothetical protein [Clostridia bacterium]